MMKKLFLLGLTLLLLTACATPAAPSPDAAAPEALATTAIAATPTTTGGMGMGMGGMGMGRRMGMGSGMMERHSAPIPAPYAGATSPVAASDAVLARGGDVYAAQCAVCHGDGGMGDGPTAAVLDPAPVPIARTSQMMRDDYLFWRVSEGGAPFNTAMPTWKETLSEQERWEVIAYVRALGAGQVAPRRGVGGTTFDPQADARQQQEILALAVAQGVITEEEAESFTVVHGALEAYRAANRPAGGDDAMGDEAEMLAALVAAGSITQAQAEAFPAIHDRLMASGLMQ